MNGPQRFEKVAHQVDAMQNTGHNFPEIVRWTNHAVGASKFTPGALRVATLEGEMVCRLNDWIVQGLHGEFYPVDMTLFPKLYKPVAVVAEVPTLSLDKAERAELDAYRAIIAESEGVYGWHLNGNPAPWDEILDGEDFAPQL